MITVVPLNGQEEACVDLIFKEKFVVANLEQKLSSHGEDWGSGMLSQGFRIGRTSILESWSSFGQGNNILPL